MGECDFRPCFKPPLNIRGQDARRAQVWVNLLAGGVQTTGTHYLRSGLTEYDCLEVLMVDVPQTLKQ